MIKTIWEEFLKIVAQEAGSHVVQTWLNAVTLTDWDAHEKMVYIRAPNIFVKEWIKSHYLSLFQLHLRRLLNVDTIKIVFLDNDFALQPVVTHLAESATHGSTIIPAIALPESAIERGNNLIVKKNNGSKYRNSINKNYQFNTFVVGPSNQLAYAAAHAVTEKLGKLYNPLFIYGDSGLGKTHLLHAIGNSIKNNNKRLETMYQTADHFVNEFINAIRFDKVHQFKEKYKEIDVLLIDDVQFISNKEQTQEAFFHIFNMLYESHKQIVFSSDSDPAGINGLAERLRSRFEWGLVTDIQIPTTETKMAILKRKAELSNQKIGDDVIEFVASRVVSNIRELEGALIRITAFAAFTEQQITLDLAKKILNNGRASKPHALDFTAIVKVLQKEYAYTLAQLRSQSRDKELSFVRQLAMYLMKKHTDKSLHEVGHFLGRKDHTTVIHAVQKIEKWLEKDVSLAHKMEEIEKNLGG